MTDNNKVVHQGYYRLQIFNNDIKFYLFNGVVTLKKHNEIIIDILNKMDGTVTLEKICNELIKKYKLEYIEKIIKLLLKYKILKFDRNYYWQYFHYLSSNPPPIPFKILDTKESLIQFKLLNKKKYSENNFCLKIGDAESNDDSQLIKLLNKRRTVREFSEEPIKFKDFINLIKVSYGISSKINIDSHEVPLRTVPMTGKLSSLDLYVLVFNKINECDAGLYYFDKFKESLILLKKGILKEDLKNCMLLNFSDSIIDQTGVCFIICADADKIFLKYAERAYRFCHLEAGHIVQNQYIYAAENNIGIVEMGGFLDFELCDFLELDPDESFPIIITAIGNKK